MNIIDKIKLLLKIDKWWKKLTKEPKMANLLKVLKGRKTHIIAVVALILGLLEAGNIYTVPVEIWPILGALGLSTLRLGVEKVKEEMKDKP